MARITQNSRQSTPWIDVLRQMLRFRLARRLFVVVISAIVVIEFIIVIPSYQNYKTQILSDIRDKARIATIAALSHRGPEQPDWKAGLERILISDQSVVGASVLNGDGSILTSIGEATEITARDQQSVIDDLPGDSERYDYFLSATETAADNDIVLRLDISPIWQELDAFLIRILGLVLIICAAVGAAVFFYVAFNLIYPLERIHDSLKYAMTRPARADHNPIPHQRTDEIGETIDLLNETLHEIGRTHRSDVAFQEKRLRDFAGAGSDWFWEMDEKLRFSYFSDQFETVTGVKPEALLGKTREETGIPNVPEEEWHQHLSALRQREPFRGFTHPRDKPDGNRVWLSISGQPVYQEDGKFIGYRGTGSDITQLYEAQQALVEAKEAAEQGNRAKSEFLAIMSHEIRTPMNGIIGMTDLLMESRLSDKQKRYSRIIQESGTALMRIINDILDLSRLEARRIMLEQAEFEYTQVVAGVIDILNPQAREKNLQLECEIDDEVEGYYLGDYGRLRQVIVNLVGNAIKFTKKGGVRIRIKKVGGDDDNPRLRTEIEDTGIGIPADAIDKLFTSFTQVDASTSRRFGGTGLGLAICRKIVEAMDGEIGVESKPGEGSLFWYEMALPRIDPLALGSGRDDTTITILQGQKFKSDKTGAQLRILVVDDVAVNLVVVEKMLEGLGYQVETASNGSEAVAAVETRHYDLIFMDIQMPDMDGLEATRQIRKLPIENSGVPIVAITANTQSSDRDACVEVGMNDFIPKPFVKKELVALLERYFPTADLGSRKAS